MGIHHVVNETDYRKQMRNAGSKLVVIKFFASWCGNCMVIAPLINKLSEEFRDQVVFLEVDVDENGDITRDEYVANIPSFVFYKKRKRLGVTSNESKLKEMILQYK